MDTETVVACQGVSKRFGDQLAVADLQLDVPAGLCFGLLGPNGAGKTTTLRMDVRGNATDPAGEVRVFGVDVAQEIRDAVRAAARRDPAGERPRSRT